MLAHLPGFHDHFFLPLQRIHAVLLDPSQLVDHLLQGLLLLLLPHHLEPLPVVLDLVGLVADGGLGGGLGGVHKLLVGPSLCVSLDGRKAF